MQEKDIIKYIKGESNQVEKKLLIEWIKKDIKHQKHYNALKAKYVSLNIDSLIVSDTEKKYNQFLFKRNRKRKYYYLGAVASILLPLILIWQFGINTNKAHTPSISIDNIVKITNTFGSQKKVVLPDGSTIVLNVKSSLTYSQNFTDSIREVTLIGEAFFDIKRDVHKPFVVRVNDMKIKVLGTSFNVRSYPKDKNIVTTLVTGKIEIIQPNKKESTILHPSQRATFDKEKSDIKIEKVVTKNTIAWREGKLIFNKTPLEQVIQDLNRKYNVDFVIESDTLLQYKFTGEFDNLSLEEVLEIIKISSPINYKHINDKVIMLNSQ